MLEYLQSYNYLRWCEGLQSWPKSKFQDLTSVWLFFCCIPFRHYKNRSCRQLGEEYQLCAICQYLCLYLWLGVKPRHGEVLIEASCSFLFSINFKYNSKDQPVAVAELGWHKSSKIRTAVFGYRFTFERFAVADLLGTEAEKQLGSSKKLRKALQLLLFWFFLHSSSASFFLCPFLSKIWWRVRNQFSTWSITVESVVNGWIFKTPIRNRRKKRNLY